MELDDKSVFPTILLIILSISIALSAYFLVIHFLVEPDLHTSHREIAILDFYDQPHDNDILILGSSYVTEGIDSYLVEKALRDQGINRSVYNLGMQAETPLSRLPELENLIASKPRLVVIGMSFRDLTNRSEIYDDRFALISQRIQIEEKYLPLFNDSQIKLLTQSPFENMLHNRKFIGGAVTHLFRNTLFDYKNPDREAIFDTNFKDPWVLLTNLTEEKKVLGAQGDFSRDEINGELNPQKTAFLYFVDRLSQNNISVIIISMPMNSYYSDIIQESSRRNFSVFLNSTGIPWYDFEKGYPSEFFIDQGHMNSAGRADFSPRVATLIASALKKRCINAV